ncbi:MAG: hypothetical protein EOO01_11655 [Chitinophagaceae bacterium]|nr:MAG: hypothetical protein EOO01_11655 [Chitinophagaceae bacterium]
MKQVFCLAAQALFIFPGFSQNPLPANSTAETASSSPVSSNKHGSPETQIEFTANNGLFMQSGGSKIPATYTIDFGNMPLKERPVFAPSIVDLGFDPNKLVQQIRFTGNDQFVMATAGKEITGSYTMSSLMFSGIIGVGSTTVNNPYNNILVQIVLLIGIAVPSFVFYKWYQRKTAGLFRNKAIC